MGPYAGVDYNLTLCPLQSRLQHIYHGKPYARVDFIPQSGTFDLASGHELFFCHRFRMLFVRNREFLLSIRRCSSSKVTLFSY
jgi:hypothetical protein